jgi:hypothetical protein
MQKSNPALDRIRQIKSKAGGGSTFESTDAFMNPIIEQAAKEVAAERVPAPVPRLQDETEEEYKMRMLEIETAGQLIQQQINGLGAIAPTQTGRYNNIDGTVDNMIVVLEDMKRKE